MNSRWLLALFLVAGALQARPFPVEIIETLDDVKVVAFISDADIKSSVSWSPMSSAPPLSIAAAIQAIKKEMAGKHDLDKATINEIELKQIPYHADHWHYLVKVSATGNNHSIDHYFVVLMSGKVIRAIKEPESYK